MARKTYINLADGPIAAELDDSPVWSENGLHTGIMFKLINKHGEVVGCLSTFIPRTTRAVWNNQNPISPQIIENLFLRILPHIPFEASLSEFTQLYPSCIKMFIESGETRYDKQQKTQYVQAQGSLQEFVNQIVFDGDIDEEKVQQDVLTYLYEAHKENHLAYSHTMTMANELFLNQNIVFRCLKYLQDDGLVEGEEAIGVPGLALVMITTPGVRFVKNNFQKIHVGAEVIIMGDYVGNDKITTNIQGDDNQNIVKSSIDNSFNMALINEKTDDLKKAISQDYTGQDKDLLLEQVEEIKTLAKEKKNFGKIREILGGVMTRTAEVATIASACLPLLQLFTGGNSGTV